MVVKKNNTCSVIIGLLLFFPYAVYGMNSSVGVQAALVSNNKLTNPQINSVIPSMNQVAQAPAQAAGQSSINQQINSAVVVTNQVVQAPKQITGSNSIHLQINSGMAVAKSVAQAPAQTTGQIAKFLDKQAGQAQSGAAKKVKKVQRHRFSQMQKDPLYIKALAVLNDHDLQESYNDTMNAINTYFTNYSKQIFVQMPTAKTPLTFLNKAGTDNAKSSIASSPAVVLKSASSASISSSILSNSAVSSSVSSILTSYNASTFVLYSDALKNLIQLHSSLSKKKPIQLTQSDVVFSAYGKIIAPYVAVINGYGRVVAQEFAKQLDYSKDLQILSDAFVEYDKQVKVISQLFPASLQHPMVESFYQQLTSNVVQTCFQVIKNVSYLLSEKDQNLQSVFVAYTLALAAQTKNMKILGLDSGTDFQTETTKYMITLYSNVIKSGLHNLAFADNTTVSTLSNQIVSYYQILFQVYTNAGKPSLANKQLADIKNMNSKLAEIKKCAHAFGTAKALPAVAKIVNAAQQKVQLSLSEIQTISTSAQSVFKNAQAAELTHDYASAVTNYGKAQVLYLQMVEIPSLSANVNANKSQYFLSKTRWTAYSLVSNIQNVGSVSLNNLPNVPKQYLINSYQLFVDLGALLTTLPTSLQSIPLGQLYTTLNTQQQSDLLQLFKAYLVYQMLSDQSIAFKDCFSDDQLQKISSISGSNSSSVDSILQQVTAYMTSILGANVAAVNIASSTALNVVLKNIPIPAVVPLYVAGICAADYFIGAYSLLKPGTALLSLYGSAYVPGNDANAAQYMLLSIAYAYCNEAYNKLTNIQAQINSLVKSIGTSTQTLPVNFASSYAQIKKEIVQMQSLLIATGSSAQSYFVQAGEQNLANMVQAVYLSMYPIAIDLMQKCLVGSPSSDQYNSILLDIDAQYLQWLSELNPKTDAALITQINQQIATLFANTGQICLKYSYQQPTFPGFTFIDYAGAAQNFLAAQQQYTSMKNASQITAMGDLMNYAYMLGCNQNIELYYFVKNHGMMYTSSSSGQSIQVSYAQLASDYAEFEQKGVMDSGEIHAYHTLQNLLLTSAMMYQYFAGLAPATSVSTATNSATAINSQEPVINYLIAQKILPATATAIPFMQQGIKEKLLEIASAAYDNFKLDATALSAWYAVLVQVVQNIYMQDYLGATAAENSTQLENQTKEFFDALQKKASSAQNPSAAYIG